MKGKGKGKVKEKERHQITTDEPTRRDTLPVAVKEATGAVVVVVITAVEAGK